MRFEKVIPFGLQFEERGSDLVVEVRPSKSISRMYFLYLTAIMAPAVLGFMGYMYWSSETIRSTGEGSHTLFIIAFLWNAVGFGLLLLTGLLWTFAGKEFIVCSGGSMEVSRVALFEFHHKVYQLSDLRSIHIPAYGPNPEAFRQYFIKLGLPIGRIRAEHAGKMIGFGASVNEAEGRHIVDEFLKRGYIKNTQLK